MNRGTRRLLKRVGALIALGLLVFGGAVGLRAVAGGEVGETCTSDYGCKLGGRCARLYGVEKTCTRNCETDGECPADWHCGAVIVVDRSDVFESTRERACLPGTPAGP
jgi:hypothetical protein